VLNAYFFGVIAEARHISDALLKRYNEIRTHAAPESPLVVRYREKLNFRTDYWTGWLTIDLPP
jgi:hypothetical protein